MPCRPAVLPDEEVHRDQHGLEEHVEQDEVLRREHPEHPDLGHEEQGKVLPEVPVHVPRSHNRYNRQERREEEHAEPEPVEADPVAYVERPDPGEVLRERRDAKVVPEGEVGVDGEQEWHGRHPEGSVAYQADVVHVPMDDDGLVPEELEATLTRLRPVLMTSAATVFGHFPLVLVAGPGAEARNSIGIVLVTGMIVGTLFTLVVVPVFYSFIAADHRRTTEEDAGEGNAIEPAPSPV